MSYRIRLLAAVCVASALIAGTADAKKKTTTRKKGAITNLKVDPKAPVVGLFKGIETKQIEVKLIQINSKKGNLLVENMTKETITVQLPDAFVGVHVLNQIGGLGGGLGGGQQGGGQQGGGQSVGGGGQGGGQQGGGQQGGGQQGGNFFSIPPEKLAKVSVASVCLEYGKPEPASRMTYRVVPIESVTKDPVLRKLMTFVATGRVNANSAQAAAWVLANGMTFNELASIKHRRLGGLPSPHMFNRAELLHAQGLIAEAKRRVEEDKKKPAKPVETVEPVKSRTTNIRALR